MARPEGAQALRAIQKDLDEGRSLHVINYIPLPGIGEGLGEWFEASSYGKKRLEMLRTCFCSFYLKIVLSVATLCESGIAECFLSKITCNFQNNVVSLQPKLKQ